MNKLISLKVHMTNFVPVYEDQNGKVLTEKELAAIAKLNDDGADIKVTETINELPTETTMLLLTNDITKWMILSRDSQNTYTNMEFSDSPLAYKVQELPEEIEEQLKKQFV